MKYHVFFTARYTKPCLENGRFGATSVNSLVDVKKGDVAFLFDGSKWEIFGPLKIISENQFYETNDIYGRNKKNIVNYPNRIAFNNKEIKGLELNKLFSLEKDSNSKNFLLNRTLLSVIIANKQVHSTPLTEKEGKYLIKCISKKGGGVMTTNDFLPFSNNEAVLDNVIKKRKNLSEAIFEMLIMTQKPSIIFDIKQDTIIYNQFILGLQRQIDILSITEKEIAVFEIKSRNNKKNPYTQIIEYLDYVNSDFRLISNNSKREQIKAIVLLEKGNKYLDKKQIPNIENLSVYSFNCDRNHEITMNTFA